MMLTKLFFMILLTAIIPVDINILTYCDKILCIDSTRLVN